MIDFGEHKPAKKSLDLTPMLDVVFLLLIFFMLTSVFAKPMLPLNLPKAESSEMVKGSPLVMSLQLDGSIFLNSVKVEIAVLETKLKEAFVENKNHELSLQADKDLDFGRVIAIMDLARLAGAESIAMVTENKK